MKSYLRSAQLFLVCLTTGLLALGSSRAQAPHPQEALETDGPSASQARDSGSLEEAQRAAGLLLMDQLRERSPEVFGRIRRCPPRSILLVDGKYDHTDRVLRALRLPFRSCTSSTFDRQSLRGVRLLIIDCPGMVGSHGARRIRGFVEEGGTLLTTDWAVLHVLEEAFPGFVRFTRSPTRDDVVRISRVEHDPLLDRLFPPGRLACWWIENRSYPVEVRDPRVRVLLYSDEMGHKYDSPILALTFRWGRGQVVHVVSHTYLQRNELRSPWERSSALDQARSLRLSDESKAFRALKANGTLERLSAGDLNAALSAQQFLLNVAAAALARVQEEPGDTPPPDEPVVTPPPAPPPRPITASNSAVRDTHLRDVPRGTPYLRVTRGLRLVVLEERDGWIRVRTPAGQSGWLERDDLERRDSNK